MRQNEAINEFFSLKASGLSNEQIAKRLKVNRGTLARWAQTAKYKELSRQAESATIDNYTR